LELSGEALGVLGVGEAEHVDVLAAAYEGVPSAAEREAATESRYGGVLSSHLFVRQCDLVWPFTVNRSLAEFTFPSHLPNALRKVCCQPFPRLLDGENEQGT
jgi:hypothetical protein